jgi:hypothetical protein
MRYADASIIVRRAFCAGVPAEKQHKAYLATRAEVEADLAEAWRKHMYELFDKPRLREQQKMLPFVLSTYVAAAMFLKLKDAAKGTP